ncbi:hypothetical protein B0H15DRAFT_847433 [Mycena belliarum]|uniref:Uncharacterized protein n=1 Tax=Mycena belliarum TaxID=1033014 RepID=A0AAD6U121_9AGAR|nr:hypothetical protein B0H15DRAFT_847433 [Mycena belliae]
MAQRRRASRVVLSLLPLATLLCIYLAWDHIRLKITTRLSQSPLAVAPPTSQTPMPSQLITNNHVKYPRRPPETLSREQAREYIDRLNAIRRTAFSPHYKYMQVHNLENVDRLLQYLARVEAGEPLSPPRVVLSSWHFQPTCYETSSNGEVQWMRPILDLMREHDIFIIYAAFPDKTFHKDFKLIGNDLITHTWIDDEHLIWCFQDSQNCMQSPQNPDGVPLWKMFAFTFWGSLHKSGKWLPPKTANISWSFNPLGREWSLVPYQMPEGHFFLGYNYQGCHALDYVPFDKRPDQIVILAKKSEYFHSKLFFNPEAFYSRLRNSTDHELITNAVVDEGFPIPDGLKSLGLIPQADYDVLLANTKALLGIGRPLISPTPYASLCRGVPVILPYRADTGCPARPGPDLYCGFDEDTHQHGPAAALGEPYIYTVDVNAPVEVALDTILRAARTPIEPFEPEEMRLPMLRARLLDYFHIDWEAHAQAKGTGLSTAGGPAVNSGALALPPWLVEWSRLNPDPTLANPTQALD